MKALVIRDTGEFERLELPEFEDVQKACGGRRVTVWVDDPDCPGTQVAKETEHVDGRIVESPSILGRHQHLTMWCNEEAQLLDMLPNHQATIVCGWWDAVYPDGSTPMLYGDVVITGPTSSSGNRTALSDLDAGLIETQLESLVVGSGTRRR